MFLISWAEDPDSFTSTDGQVTSLGELETSPGITAEALHAILDVIAMQYDLRSGWLCAYDGRRLPDGRFDSFRQLRHKVTPPEHQAVPAVVN